MNVENWGICYNLNPIIRHRNLVYQSKPTYTHICTYVESKLMNVNVKKALKTDQYTLTEQSVNF